LRRIVYQDPETEKVYVFLTNHLRLAAKTIADIHKERWLEASRYLNMDLLKEHKKLRISLAA